MRCLSYGAQLLAHVVTLTVIASLSAWGQGTTERVSLGQDKAQARGVSGLPAISASGNFVCFVSDAANLVPGDTNGSDDVFVRDRARKRTERVSIGLAGIQANAYSYYCAISGDGQVIAFSSAATNLVRGDVNGRIDIFVRDRMAVTTEIVNVGQSGVQANKGSGLAVAISGSGRFVSFISDATNLVPDDTNRVSDLFLRDRQTDRTERVSLGRSGVQGNGNTLSGGSISADGRFVVFESQSTNLVPNDTNRASDIFVRDRQLGTTERVSLGRGGVQANGGSGSPSISADGRFVTFTSGATNLVAGDTNGFVDQFVYDRQARTTNRVSIGPNGVEANDDSFDILGSDLSSISADGRFVVFTSLATNLVAKDSNNTFDVFIRDRKLGKTSRVSVGPSGAQAQAMSFAMALSADGRFVAFVSSASNMVPRDTNHADDVFVRFLGF